MKLKYFLFLAFSAVNFAQANPVCRLSLESGYVRTSQSDFHSSEIAREIREFRARRIWRTDLLEVLINGVHYIIEGRLGTGSSIVYLAQAPNGERVTIKKIFNDNDTWVNSVYYEQAASRYYNQYGISVPHVLDFEVLANGTAYLVRKYRAGITGNELEQNIIFQSRDRNRLLQSMVEAVDFYTSVHQGEIADIPSFATWLHENNINLYATPFPQMDRLIRSGDHDERNMLFDAETLRWISFDP